MAAVPCMLLWGMYAWYKSQDAHFDPYLRNTCTLETYDQLEDHLGYCRYSARVNFTQDEENCREVFVSKEYIGVSVEESLYCGNYTVGHQYNCLTNGCGVSAVAGHSKDLVCMSTSADGIRRNCDAIFTWGFVFLGIFVLGSLG